MILFRLKALSSLICILAAVSYVAVKPTQAADATIDGWLLDQNTRTEGAQEVKIGKNCVRIKGLKSNLVVQVAAPWQEVSIFSPVTHNIYNVPYATFRNPYLKLRNMYDGGNLTEITPVPAGNEKLFQFNCHKFVEPRGFALRQKDLRKKMLVTGRAAANVSYLTTDDMHLDKHVGEMLTRFYALPELNEVPLQFKFVDVVGNSNNELITTICQKHRFTAQDFQIPANLKKVKSAEQVTVSDNQNGEYDLMMMESTRGK